MYSAPEKPAIIRLMEDSESFVRRTLVEISVSRSSFYRWYQTYEREGPDGLQSHSRASRQHWNKIPESVRELVVDVALDQPELTPREPPNLRRSPSMVSRGRGTDRARRSTALIRASSSRGLKGLVR